MKDFYLPNTKYRSVLYNTIFIFLLLTAFLVAQDKNDENNTSINDSTLISRQHMIHSRSHMVMPFDMSKVTHYFIKTDNGGMIEIKAKEAKDSEQISLIRKHLKKEEMLFSSADFRDPKTLHGKNMPGLKILSKSAGKYKVEYEQLPLGARLVFISKDQTVLNALHKWFDAQLRDHGNDAENHLDNK